VVTISYEKGEVEGEGGGEEEGKDGADGDVGDRCGDAAEGSGPGRVGRSEGLGGLVRGLVLDGDDRFSGPGLCYTGDCRARCRVEGIGLPRRSSPGLVLGGRLKQDCASS